MVGASMVGASMASASSCDEPPQGATVHACDETSEPVRGSDQIDTDRWAELAAAVLCDEGIPHGELGLRFVDPGVMAELNLAHMGAPGPTDVLAFPIDGGSGGLSAPEPALLGDVVVCPAYAAYDDPRPPDDLDEELALLVVHGVLHVLGYDHAVGEEAAAMRARERQLLAAHHRQP